MLRADRNAFNMTLYELRKPFKVLIAGLAAHRDDTVHDLSHAVHGGFRLGLPELLLYDIDGAQKRIVSNQPVQYLSAVIPGRHGFTQGFKELLPGLAASAGPFFMAAAPFSSFALSVSRDEVRYICSFSVFPPYRDALRS